MALDHLLGLECGHCGRRFPPDGDIQTLCPDCEPLYATLECRINYHDAQAALRKRPLRERREPSMFRYSDLLPITDASRNVPLQIGWTPVYSCPRAATVMGLKDVLVKDDGVNPSASYKDRASAMVVGRAMELGYDAVCTASTGNAAASLAACCRSVEMPCVVFVPSGTPQSKLIQMLAYGACVIPVAGTYDDAFNLAVDACEEFGWMNRSAGYSPYLVEGKKTGALELVEQTSGSVPDSVFVSVGDGSIITGLCKGFSEAVKLGLISRLPKVFGVQATGASVLVNAWNTYRETGELSLTPMPAAATIADSICVGTPREGIRAVQAVHATGGGFIAVDESAIRAAIRELPLETGVFGEPASATAYAGLKEAVRRGIVNTDASVAVFITGSGLKDIRSAADVLVQDSQPLILNDRVMEQVKERIEEHEKR
ncbi:threonine synthase [bacterium]|nr:threonine synthase [candidate division CSSED10-310 bacterium]